MQGARHPVHRRWLSADVLRTRGSRTPLLALVAAVGRAGPGLAGSSAHVRLRSRRQAASAKRGHGCTRRFQEFTVEAREGDELVAVANASLPQYADGLVLENRQFGIGRVAAVKEVFVRKGLAFVVAYTDHESLAAGAGDAGPQEAVAVIARSPGGVALHRRGHRGDGLAGAGTRPGLAAILADDDPAMVARVLACVHHDCAVGKLHQLALVGQRAEQAAAPPTGPVVVTVERVGAHDFNASAKGAQRGPQVIGVGAHGRRDEKAACSGLNGPARAQEHGTPVVVVARASRNVAGGRPGAALVVAGAQPGLVFHRAGFRLRGIDPRLPAVVEDQYAAVGAIDDRGGIGGGPFLAGIIEHLRGRPGRAIVRAAFENQIDIAVAGIVTVVLDRKS